MFGLVGESGSGKSTTGRCILRLIEPTSGEVLFRGENVLQFSRDRMRAARRDMQIVFQDPYSSLNPRMRVGDIVEEPLIIHGLGGRAERRARVAELFELVGLERDALDPLPARVQRRAASAHRHRARAGAEPGARHCRRSGIGARRLDSGAGRQAPARLARASEADVPVHRARSASRRAHLQPGGGDVSGKSRRARGHAAHCSPVRRTPTRGRCSARFRCSIRMHHASGFSSIRRRSTGRRRCGRSAQGTGRRFRLTHELTDCMN